MPTLQDLMGLIQNGQGRRPGQGNLLASLAPMLAQGGGVGGVAPDPGYDRQLQDQINVLSQPEPVVDAPVGKQSPLLSKILAGIADAGSVYAGGLNPYVRPMHAFGALREEDQRNLDVAAANKQRKENAESKGKKAKAEMEIQRILGERKAQGDALGLAEERAYQAKSKALEAQDKARQTAENRAFEVAQQKQKQDFEIQMAATKQRGEMALAKLREQVNSGDKFAAEQHKLLGEAYAGVSEMSAGVEAGLKAGTPPDAYRKLFMRKIKELRLEGPARDAAIADFSEEVEPILAKAEFQSEFENQGPLNPSSQAAPLSTTGQILSQHGP